ncbi:hypothetical protein CA13_36090 [Planctomycetes bacterium CA13]|uniref:Circumsporozoite protein-putative membrane associated protein n=1 Tax=Novipirellula herctigrandis TaxID=2527986 RepID=A0A5C5Z484_9BACT|nr:hypothetical protein CA13_36090 [Planctomycetes bacterium CA13]
MSASTPTSTRPLTGKPPGRGAAKRSFDEVASLVESRIHEAQNALWWAELVRNSLKVILGVGTALLAWVIFDQWIYSPGILFRLVFCVALLGWISWMLVKRIWPVLTGTIRPEYAARSIERDNPEMRQELTSFVTLRDQQDDSGLRGKVIRSVGAHAAARLRKNDALPAEATGTMAWWLASIAMLAVIGAYGFASPKNSLQSARRLLMPTASIDPAKRVAIKDVKPGNQIAIAGRTIAISATISGLPNDEPAWCRWQLPDRAVETEMLRDQESERYVGEIILDHSTAGEVPYWIFAGDAQAGPFTLRVQDVPVVAIESVAYQPPDYTGSEPHTSSSAAITAIDGTRVTIRAKVNRPVQNATIQFNPKPLGDSVRATAGKMEMQIDESGTFASVSFPVRHVRQRSAAVQLESYRVEVQDETGQTNPEPIVYPIRVIADLAPEVTIVMPQQSPKNIPIDSQQIIEIHAADPDFGLRRIEVEIRRGIDVLPRITLWEETSGATGNQIAEYRFRPLEHFLRVGDSVQVIAIATDNRLDDNDPLVEANVTMTDPVELNITMSSGSPSEEPESGDGISAPDESPATDSTGQQQSEGGQGGSSGGSGEQSGEKQEGDSEGSGGSSSSGGEGESQEKQQDGSKNDSQGGAESDSPSGDPKSNGNASDSNQNQQNQPQTGDNNANDGMNPSSPNGSPDTNNQGSEAQPQQGQSSEQTGTEPSDPTQNGEPQPDGAEASGAEANGAETNGAETNGTETNGTNSNGTESKESHQQQRAGTREGQQGTSQQGQSSNQQGTPESESGPPQHDGEAFERIRDYLDKKKNEQSGQGSQGKQTPQNDPQNKSDQASENDSPQGDDEQDSGNQQDDENQQSASGKQGAEEGTSQPEGSGSDQPTGSEQQGSEQQGSEQQGSEQQGSEQQGSEQGDSINQTGSAEKQSSDGKQGTDSQSTGDKQSGQEQTGNSGEQGKSGEQGQSSDQQGDSSAQPANDGSSGEDPQRNDAKTGSDAQPSESKQPSMQDSSSQSPPPNGSNPSSQASTNPSSASQGSSGDATGTDIGGDISEPPTTPNPVDLDYAKKATDMVLDYLEETRDSPDQNLLDDLNWSENDLQRFADRWKNVRQIDNVDSEQQRDLAESLESLGIRPPTQSTTRRQEQADALRGLRDAGNRTPPPAAYRDAFESFRRAIGRQNP